MLLEGLKLKELLLAPRGPLEDRHLRTFTEQFYHSPLLIVETKLVLARRSDDSVADLEDVCGSGLGPGKI